MLFLVHPGSASLTHKYHTPQLIPDRLVSKSGNSTFVPLFDGIISQAPIDFLCENTKHLPLDLIIAEQQREEILILFETFDQSIIYVIKIREFKILYGICSRTRLQLIGLQQDTSVLTGNISKHRSENRIYPHLVSW